MQNNEIIGYSRFENKEKQERMVVDVAKLPSDFDKKYGRVGMKVEQIWIPSSCMDKFNEGVIGKILKCTYEVNGRYANVTDVVFE